MKFYLPCDNVNLQQFIHNFVTYYENLKNHFKGAYT